MGALVADAGLAVRGVVVQFAPAPSRAGGAGPARMRRGDRDDDRPRRVASAVTTAVDGVSLDVAPGEVVALLGPSGCGKSSLLRAVAGLEPLARGEVRWDGEDLVGLPVHRRGFGLMFQDGQLFPHRDVGANVAFGLRMARVERQVRERRVVELLDLVGLAGFGRRAVSTLSGGEAQRVALARALAPQPRLLLLDEPLSALDRALREQLATDLRSILTSAGTTALYVTHDHDEAFTVADRVAVMRAGRLAQVDTPAGLWAAPADAGVAAFLGRRVVRAPGGRLLALRPDAWRVGEVARGPSAEPASAAVAVDAVVLAVGFRRGRTELAVEIPEWGQQVALADGVLDVAPGDLVRAGLNHDAVVEIRDP